MRTTLLQTPFLRSLLSLLLSIAVLSSGSLFSMGCSTRAESGTWTADSTLVYPGKIAGDVTCTITFCEKFSSKTGQCTGVSRSFEMMEDAKVRAVIHLENVSARGDDDLSFHLVWLDPNDDTIFKKRVEVTPDPSNTTLTSSLSITPDNRELGRYKFRLYLFRELMAEKSFELY
ncbi:MAG: hypothetical protein KJ970_15510 [Candidatus Eisenbacteria bacterium]|uniref:Uncharacterized protein n=1 Tax=Eiseniibacteriota bacterium TaxID=2212470 RepID=A0A948S1W7_UNCEI|nr:hypothetical protein [Candidatus Eisenbacteria bacterium]MBU1948613.1 hypothetical protein [Candidatus Eisenbacteria bacterium]MBU2692329.1 hypothetical protein [Candidatus Eisenbacteria bacterium]